MTHIPVGHVCKKHEDERGVHYTVEKDGTDTEDTEIWWSRSLEDKSVECLVIRQANAEDRADVIMLSLGQAYDLIDALNRAVMDR